MKSPLDGRGGGRSFKSFLQNKNSTSDIMDKTQGSGSKVVGKSVGLSVNSGEGEYEEMLPDSLYK